MIKVAVKEEGVKLNGKWCFKGDEQIINSEEYENNKDYLIVLEDETEKINSEIENTESIDNVSKVQAEPTLQELKNKAKELGIKVPSSISKEKLIEAINEMSAPNFGDVTAE